MRTVADLRRVLGVGAPRERDSLYAPVERAPRKFNPLRVPKKLQARDCAFTAPAAALNVRCRLHSTKRRQKREGVPCDAPPGRLGAG